MCSNGALLLKEGILQQRRNPAFLQAMCRDSLATKHSFIQICLAQGHYQCTKQLHHVTFRHDSDTSSHTTQCLITSEARFTKAAGHTCLAYQCATNALRSLAGACEFSPSPRVFKVLKCKKSPRQIRCLADFSFDCSRQRACSWS